MKYDFNGLRFYALKYYYRYYPSKNKLLKKLVNKSNNETLSNKVLEDISHLIDDKKIIKEKINFYLLKNKNINYIKRKLQEKLFLKNDFIDILKNDFHIEEESLLKKDYLLKKIVYYKEKGKSIQYIKTQLIETNFDREVVHDAILEVFINGDEDNIKKELQKMYKKFDQSDIIKKLINKGFNYNDIKKYV